MRRRPSHTYASALYLLTLANAERDTRYRTSLTDMGLAGQTASQWLRRTQRDIETWLEQDARVLRRAMPDLPDDALARYVSELRQWAYANLASLLLATATPDGVQ